jgi:hypothetical protein
VITRKPECCVEYLDNSLVMLICDYAPGQILVFVVCSVEEFPSQSAGILAVVNTCGFLHNKKGSIFSTIWKQDYTDMHQTIPSLVP